MTSNTPFTFPPPPPPPPRASGLQSGFQNGYSGGQNHGSWINSGNVDRGGRRGGESSRGRGNNRGRRPYQSGQSRNAGSFRRQSHSGGSLLPVNGIFPDQAFGSHEFGAGGQGFNSKPYLQQYGMDQETTTSQTGILAASVYSGSNGYFQQPSKRVRLSPSTESFPGLPGPTFPKYLQNGNDHLNERNSQALPPSRSNLHNKTSRPLPAPSVPSFLSSLPGISAIAESQKSTEAARQTKNKKRTSNTLGLTPSLDTEEKDVSGAEDIDEEAVIVPSLPRDQLVVNYKGRTANLSNPAELAAWIGRTQEKVSHKRPRQRRIEKKERK